MYGGDIVAPPGNQAANGEHTRQAWSTGRSHSTRLNCSDRVFCDKLTVVISPNDAERHSINIEDIGNFITHVCKYTQYSPWYSSATTLIMNRLKFSGQKFAKCPCMIRQSGGHTRGSMLPLGLNQARARWSLIRQRQTQTRVRPGKVVEGLEEGHAPPHVGTILNRNTGFFSPEAPGHDAG